MLWVNGMNHKKDNAYNLTDKNHNELALRNKKLIVRHYAD